MNILRKVILVFMILHSSNDGFTQNIPFEKIEYASFDVKPSKSKHANQIKIDIYYRIEKSGLVTILHNDDYHHTLTFNTYQLNTIQLKKINSVFNYVRHLKDFVIRNELEKDEFFQGTYKFFAVIYGNARKDSLCFIVPFMSNDFQDVYHMLDSIYWVNKNRLKEIRPFVIPKYFKNQVEWNFRKSGLPKKKPLPSFRREEQ